MKKLLVVAMVLVSMPCFAYGDNRLEALEKQIKQIERDRDYERLDNQFKENNERIRQSNLEWRQRNGI